MWSQGIYKIGVSMCQYCLIHLKRSSDQVGFVSSSTSWIKEPYLAQMAKITYWRRNGVKVSYSTIYNLLQVCKRVWLSK